MKIQFNFVPQGGGETDFTQIIEMPSVPNVGDYITMGSSESGGTEDFIVKRSWYYIKREDDKVSPGTCEEIVVECEFAIGPFSSDSHKKSCENYQIRKGVPAKIFDDSTY